MLISSNSFGTLDISWRSTERFGIFFIGFFNSLAGAAFSDWFFPVRMPRPFVFFQLHVQLWFKTDLAKLCSKVSNWVTERLFTRKCGRKSFRTNHTKNYTRNGWNLGSKWKPVQYAESNIFWIWSWGERLKVLAKSTTTLRLVKQTPLREADITAW